MKRKIQLKDMVEVTYLLNYLIRISNPDVLHWCWLSELDQYPKQEKFLKSFTSPKLYIHEIEARYSRLGYPLTIYLSIPEDPALEIFLNSYYYSFFDKLCTYRIIKDLTFKTVSERSHYSLTTVRCVLDDSQPRIYKNRTNHLVASVANDFVKALSLKNCTLEYYCELPEEILSDMETFKTQDKQGIALYKSILQTNNNASARYRNPKKEGENTHE